MALSNMYCNTKTLTRSEGRLKTCGTQYFFDYFSFQKNKKKMEFFKHLITTRKIFVASGLLFRVFLPIAFFHVTFLLFNLFRKTARGVRKQKKKTIKPKKKIIANKCFICFTTSDIKVALRFA